MYKCNYCNEIIPENESDGRIVKAGPKMYCAKCGEPVVQIPDAPPASSAFHGAHATLISNSDNRITTNNYYGGGMHDEQVDTPFGKYKRSETRLCKHCKQWIPLAFFNIERDLCENCISLKGEQYIKDGKAFYDVGLYDEALKEFQKFEQSCCDSGELSEVWHYMGRCYYEQSQWKEAFKFFIKSRDHSADSLYYIGLCFRSGYGVVQNIDKANEYFELAAVQGVQEAYEIVQKEKQRQLLEKQKKEEAERKRMSIRLNKAIRELNIGLQTAVDFFDKHKELGEVEGNLNVKLSDEQYNALVKEFKGKSVND